MLTCQNVNFGKNCRWHLVALNRRVYVISINLASTCDDMGADTKCCLASSWSDSESESSALTLESLFDSEFEKSVPDGDRRLLHFFSKSVSRMRLRPGHQLVLEHCPAISATLAALLSQCSSTLVRAFSGFFVMQQIAKCPSFLHLLHILPLAGRSASSLMRPVRPHLKYCICDAAYFLLGVCGRFICLFSTLFILKSLIPSMLHACLSAVSMAVAILLNWPKVSVLSFYNNFVIKCNDTHLSIT